MICYVYFQASIKNSVQIKCKLCFENVQCSTNKIIGNTKSRSLYTSSLLPEQGKPQNFYCALIGVENALN